MPNRRLIFSNLRGGVACLPINPNVPKSFADKNRADVCPQTGPSIAGPVCWPNVFVFAPYDESWGGRGRGATLCSA